MIFDILFGNLDSGNPVILLVILEIWFLYLVLEISLPIIDYWKWIFHFTYLPLFMSIGFQLWPKTMKPNTIRFGSNTNRTNHGFRYTEQYGNEINGTVLVSSLHYQPNLVWYWFDLKIHGTVPWPALQFSTRSRFW